MVGLAFAVAASANFPALLLALTWRRFNTAGAVTGVLFGVVSALALIIMSPNVWGGAPGAPDTGSPISWYDLTNPGIDLDPARLPRLLPGDDALDERETERSFHELYVRSETGLGAERAVVHLVAVPRIAARAVGTSRRARAPPLC